MFLNAKTMDMTYFTYLNFKTVFLIFFSNICFGIHWNEAIPMCNEYIFFE